MIEDVLANRPYYGHMLVQGEKGQADAYTSYSLNNEGKKT